MLMKQNLRIFNDKLRTFFQRKKKDKNIVKTLKHFLSRLCKFGCLPGQSTFIIVHVTWKEVPGNRVCMDDAGLGSGSKGN
jgi:uncharacterized protein YutD